MINKTVKLHFTARVQVTRICIILQHELVTRVCIVSHHGFESRQGFSTRPNFFRLVHLPRYKGSARLWNRNWRVVVYHRVSVACSFITEVSPSAPYLPVTSKKLLKRQLQRQKSQAMSALEVGGKSSVSFSND